MKVIDISSKQLRFKMGEVLNFAYYGGGLVRITRRKSVAAYLIGEPLMRVIDQLLEENPNLADAAASMHAQEILNEIRQSIKESSPTE